MDDAIDIPRTPAALPSDIAEQWRNAYIAAYKEEQADYPNKPHLWKKEAVKASARVITVPDLQSYEDAMSLELWQIVYREEHVLHSPGSPDHGLVVLKVITRDGKKYQFAVPGRERQEPQKPSASRELRTSVGMTTF